MLSSLNGQGWDHFPLDPSSGPSSDDDDDPASKEDVMTLPKRDMSVFGQCPVHDEFVLVVCDICGRSVKMEAFRQHFRLRHDRNVKGSRISKIKSFNCTVDLTKEDLALSASSSSSNYSSSAATTPSNSRASSVAAPAVIPPASKRSRSTSPASSVKEEPMDLEEAPAPPPRLTLILPPKEPKVLGPDEADSTTTINNVISIPDTDPLPHNMSNDLVAVVSELPPSSVKVEPRTPVDSTTPTIQINSPSVIKLQINQTPLAPSQFSRLDINPVFASPIKKTSPSKKSGGRGDRKPLREYHPDKHCGVWDNDSKRHCTRALTCKSHSVLLKRKITGRSKSFDELVAEHKAMKEAQATVQAQVKTGIMPPPNSTASSGQTTPTLTGGINVESVLNSVTGPNPIETVRIQHINGVANKVVTSSGVNSPGWSRVSSLVGVKVASPKSSSKRSLLVNSSPISSPLASSSSFSEVDEDLHYTTDHPKPLAVCTFGAKRLGGLLVADRSQFLTRKVVRVAISASSGFRVRDRLNGGGTSQFRNGTSIVKKTIPSLPPRIVTSIATTITGSPHIQQQQQQQGTFVVSHPVQVHNANSVLNAVPTMRRVGFSTAPPTGVTTLAGSVVTSAGGIQRISGVNLAPMPVQSSAAGGTTMTFNLASKSEGSFKTDIQDFKGGIKFELGRQIKHILPSGNEISK